jgi:hypothetical protein
VTYFLWFSVFPPSVVSPSTFIVIFFFPTIHYLRPPPSRFRFV